MSVQLCEGIWRVRCGQRVFVTQCEPVDGQRWTNGVDHYSDDGSFWGDGRESAHDLVSFVGLLPDKSQGDQTAENERLQAEIERLQAEWQSKFTAAQQLRSENDRLRSEVERSQAEIERLRTEMCHRAEGAQLAYLRVIKTLLEMRR